MNAIMASGRATTAPSLMFLVAAAPESSVELLPPEGEVDPPEPVCEGPVFEGRDEESVAVPLRRSALRCISIRTVSSFRIDYT